MCIRYPVCARLPEGAKHPCVYDRGRQLRYDQDAVDAVATGQLASLRASRRAESPPSTHRGRPLHLRRLQDNKLPAHLVPDRLVCPGQPLDPGHLLARLRADSARP